MGRRWWSSGGLTTRSLLARLTAALADHEPTRAERDPPYREAAVALILVPRGDDADLLLMRRATHAPDPWSGQVALPGGRHEPDDASLLATAIRETREETAVDLSGARLLGGLDELRPRVVALPPIVVSPFVFAVDERPALTPSLEVADLFWVSVDKLFDPSRTVRTDVAPRGVTMTVDAIDIDGRIIWGMTERILRSFERVLGSAG